MEATPLRTGGQEETQAVIDKYQSMVYGLAFAKTGSRADADDVFQEVFLAYLNTRKEFHDEEHRKAWLLRVTVNLSRRVTAATSRRKNVPLEDAETVAAPFREPEENRVWEALQSLTEEQRLPIYLFYFEDLPTEAIAQALGLRPGTVRMRMTRGRERLRVLLKGDYFDEA